MNSNCVNCQRSITGKTGLFSSVQSNQIKHFSDEYFKFISKYTNVYHNSFCDICYDIANENALDACRSEYLIITKAITAFQNLIPILSIQNLPSWDYEVISIVTGQSTMGTGFLTELKSSWGDFIGVESKSVNLKITEGETNCFKQMKAKTIALGGNAIVGVDIDYAEMGGVKSMVMVCAAGTAINVKNYEVFEKGFAAMNDTIILLKEEFDKIKPEIEHLKKYGRF